MFLCNKNCSGLCHARIFTYLSAAKQNKQNRQWHGKYNIKSEIITPFGGIFHVRGHQDAVVIGDG